MAQNRILALPRVSDEFKDFINKGPIRPKEWMPCPRCGSKTVTPPSGAGAGAAAGISLMGCATVFFALVALVVFAISPPVGILIGIISAILIIALPFLGANQAAQYKCGSCQFVWLGKEASDFQSRGNKAS